MKIAISTCGGNLDAPLSARFGRAPNFLIWNEDDESFCVIDNKKNLNAAQGAGVQSAMNIVESGAEAAITGHCGPKAFFVLKKAGIKVYLSKAETVREALKQYCNGELKASEDADVEGHWA